MENEPKTRETKVRIRSRYPGVYRRCLTTCPASCREHRWEWMGEAKPDATGRRRQLSGSGFPTAKDAANDRARALKTAATASVEVDANRRTVEQSMRTWLVDKEHGRKGLRQIKATTLTSYSGYVADYWTPLLGTVRLDRLTKADIRRALDRLDDQHARLVAKRTEAKRTGKQVDKLTGASKARIYATFRAFVRDMIRLDALDHDPTLGVTPPKATRYTHTRLTLEQARALLAGIEAVPDPALRIGYRLALSLGLRRGELAGLRWDSISLDEGTLRVERTRVVAGTTVVDQDGAKSLTSARTVHLDPDLVSRLRAHRTSQAQQRMAAGAAWADTAHGGLVLTDALGRGVAPERLTKGLRAVLQGAGLPTTVRLHDLRHTSAALGAAAGESIVEVQRRLGHAQQSLTADLYSFAFSDVARESAKRRANLLSGSASLTRFPDTSQAGEPEFG